MRNTITSLNSSEGSGTTMSLNLLFGEVSQRRSTCLAENISLNQPSLSSLSISKLKNFLKYFNLLLFLLPITTQFKSLLEILSILLLTIANRISFSWFTLPGALTVNNSNQSTRNWLRNTLLKTKI